MTVDGHNANGLGRKAILRRAAHHLALGTPTRALTWVDRLETTAIDGECAILRGQILLETGDRRGAAHHLTRAYILDAPDALATVLAAARRGLLEPQDEEAFRRVVLAKGVTADIEQATTLSRRPVAPKRTPDWATDLWTCRIDTESRRPFLLSTLIGWAGAFKAPKLARALTQMAMNLDAPLTLAVAGEFNAGKSTFINALLGRNASATGVVPTTAHVESFPYPEGGASGSRPIALLDTPGVNALNIEHAAITRRVLRDVDAVLWLMDATQPLKQSERSFLERLCARGIPVQLILNKRDRLTPAQFTEVASQTTLSLNEIGCPSWTPVLGVSARQHIAGGATDAAMLAASGWHAFEAWLGANVLSNQGDLRTLMFRRRLAPLVSRLIASGQHMLDADHNMQAAMQTTADTFARRAATLDHPAIDLFEDYDALLLTANNPNALHRPLAHLESLRVALLPPAS